MPVSVEAQPVPAKAMAVSSPRRHSRAQATAVSDKRAVWSTGPRCDTQGQRRGPDRRQNNAPNQTTATRPHWCGGRRRDRRARLRCPWAAAEPDQAIQSDPAPLVRRAPEGPEGTGEPQNAGPGRGAGGRWQGQGGPRDRPLRAAGSRVAISRAGRRPPAHTAAGPSGARNTSGATSINTQREAARPHRDQAAHASGDSYQKPRISQRSRWRRRGRPRR